MSHVPLTDPALFAEVGPQSLNPPYPRLFDYYDDYSLPYTRQYSVAVEQPLGGVTSLSVSYVGAAGRRLSRVESLRPRTLRNPLFRRVDTVSNGAYSDYHSFQTQLRRRMSRGSQALLSYFAWAVSAGECNVELTDRAFRDLTVLRVEKNADDSITSARWFNGLEEGDIPDGSPRCDGADGF